jgi:holo-[acyl-carrier protein] synthase
MSFTPRPELPVDVTTEVMAPRAFPYALKVGTDICYIPRIKSLLSKNAGTERETQPLSQFLTKVLTWPERQYFFDRFGTIDSAYSNINGTSQYLAGR